MDTFFSEESALFSGFTSFNYEECLFLRERETSADNSSSFLKPCEQRKLEDAKLQLKKVKVHDLS